MITATLVDAPVLPGHRSRSAAIAVPIVVMIVASLRAGPDVSSLRAAAEKIRDAVAYLA